MQTDSAKDLCDQLMHADAEADVIALLTKAGYWHNPACWRYYGDQELNWSQAGGQQGRADFALNEKATNSIDAVLTVKCLLEGIDPEGPAAPTSIREAVAKFIEHSAKLTTSGGRVEDWSVTFRTKVAENISIFTTEAAGSKSSTKPSVNIADLGEGHTPEAFPDTLVSLGKRNKASVPFVQGKFCQGGSGAIRGTLMKLYAYQLKSTGNIIRRDGLLYKLDLLLPDPALPIRMHECRKRAHGQGEKGASEQSTTMSGLFARLQKSDNLEDTPPMSMPITIQGKQIIARVFAFKPNGTYFDSYA